MNTYFDRTLRLALKYENDGKNNESLDVIGLLLDPKPDLTFRELKDMYLRLALDLNRDENDNGYSILVQLMSQAESRTVEYNSTLIQNGLKMALEMGISQYETILRLITWIKINIKVVVTPPQPRRRKPSVTAPVASIPPTTRSSIPVSPSEHIDICTPSESPSVSSSRYNLVTSSSNDPLPPITIPLSSPDLPTQAPKLAASLFSSRASKGTPAPSPSTKSSSSSAPVVKRALAGSLFSSRPSQPCPPVEPARSTSPPLTVDSDISQLSIAELLTLADRFLDNGANSHDMEEALKCYHRVIEIAHPDDFANKMKAYMGIGDVFFIGAKDSFPPNLSKAVEAYNLSLMLAEQLDDPSIGLLNSCIGCIYFLGGNDVPKDFVRAYEYYDRAIKYAKPLGSKLITIYIRMGDICRMGQIPDMPKDLDKAIRFYRMAKNHPNIDRKSLSKITWKMSEVYDDEQKVKEIGGKFSAATSCRDATDKYLEELRTAQRNISDDDERLANLERIDKIEARLKTVREIIDQLNKRKPNLFSKNVEGSSKRLRQE